MYNMKYCKLQDNKFHIFMKALVFSLVTAAFDDTKSYFSTFYMMIKVNKVNHTHIFGLFCSYVKQCLSRKELKKLERSVPVTEQGVVLSFVHQEEELVLFSVAQRFGL